MNLWKTVENNAGKRGKVWKIVELKKTAKISENSCFLVKLSLACHLHLFFLKTRPVPLFEKSREMCKLTDNYSHVLKKMKKLTVFYCFLVS